MPTFTANDPSRLVGFLSLNLAEHPIAEIHVMAIDACCRNQGIGTRLLLNAQCWLVDQAFTTLQVKTLGTTSKDPAYRQTRAFYRARGFHHAADLPNEWDHETPCVLLSKDLA